MGHRSASSTRSATSALSAAIVAALALAGCTGGSSSGSGSNGGFGGGTGGGPTDNVPFHIASSDDLAIYACHVHQDYYSNPSQLGFYWSVRSTFATDVHNIDWKLERLDGAHEVHTGTISTVPANNLGGDGHQLAYPAWHESTPGRHTYRLTINTNHAQSEAFYDNDYYIFVVDVPGTSTPSMVGDFEYYAAEAHFHAMLPGNAYDFHFQVANRTATKTPKTKWRLQDPLEGIDNTYDLDEVPVFDANDKSTLGETSQEVKLLQPGLHTVTMTIDSANQVTETNESNNVRVFYILVGAPASNG